MNGFKAGPRNQTKARVSQIRITIIATREIPLPFDLRIHPNVLDGLPRLQFGLQSVRIQELSDLTKLAGDEMPDTPDLR